MLRAYLSAESLKPDTPSRTVTSIVPLISPYLTVIVPLPVQSERQDTVYRKLVQFLAFNVTIPGIPMIGEGDEIGWPKKEGILGQGEEWTDEQLNVKSKLSALNQLRGEHMALLYLEHHFDR